MDAYIEFSVLSMADISTQHVFNSLFEKIHFALVNYGKKNIGVSFPEAKMIEAGSTGRKIRLHGTRQDLEMLMASGWARRFQDYVIISDILSVPNNVEFRTIFRIQEKNSNPERLRRRAMKRHNLTAEETEKQIPHTAQKVFSRNLPFIVMRSASTGQRFKLFFRFGEKTSSPSLGEFTTYGFSKTATIPWF